MQSKIRTEDSRIEGDEAKLEAKYGISVSGMTSVGLDPNSPEAIQR